MKAPCFDTVDANTAVASIAYRASEVIAIYPITPSSPMAELAEEWAAAKRDNVWGVVPSVTMMQSEAGVAGAMHGALQAGALSTTFTASQGLLLMIPNLYKIAGELTPFCLHVTARALATHALSIFGDQSDVMACRQTGFALLASNSVQEAQDLALIAHAATLRSRIPFLHFFDGFRTSHEINKIETISDETIRKFLGDWEIGEFRDRALSPDHPAIRGTAQNPDVYFQGREAVNLFYAALPSIVQDCMNRFGALTGRHYNLFDYAGHPEAEQVIVAMGSGCETIEETSRYLNERGEKTGVLKVRLFRPFSIGALLGALPPTVRSIAVLDRTKEPGSLGEPLYLDIVSALAEARSMNQWRLVSDITVIGGRYGLGSKEFTPGMAKAVFDELKAPQPRNHFTIGIKDDIMGTSLPYDAELSIEGPEVQRSIFFGLGADGTVGANKNSIKIIGTNTDNYVQGYFVYDSKKSGAMTISHLRFGPHPIHSPYLIQQAQFVACHQFMFVERYDILEHAEPGAVFLLNSPYAADKVWHHLPRECQDHIVRKNIRFYAIDAYAVARAIGMGGRINTIMQTCFFAISGILPREEAIQQIKNAIKKSYGNKGADVVAKNCAAVDQTLASLQEVIVPDAVTAEHSLKFPVPPEAPKFVQRVTAAMLANQGDRLPVSAFPPDGTWPAATSQWEKRGIAQEIPVWDESICIQCNKCVLICPHAAIRAKYYPASRLDQAPADFPSTAFRSSQLENHRYTLQVSPDDCTGCELCATVCPVKDKKNPEHKALEMLPARERVEAGRRHFEFFRSLPEVNRTDVKMDVKGTQFLQPLFEFSGACAGCGETPYIKLLTQLFGDRLLIANATGCSSIYGGNLPTTPYTVNRDGRGPAWSNSLFEDNAEYGLGIRLAIDQHTEQARFLLSQLAPRIGVNLVVEILKASQENEAEIQQQRARVAELQRRLHSLDNPLARRLERFADYLVRKSIWIVGGDGWAYDIGYGGLDHVLSTSHDVNILVLDTELYSNTGGQQSKSTPLGATAKFATNGKKVAKKDLALLAMMYGTAYVARVAIGGRDVQTIQSLVEAESYHGPSLVIGYSHCIAHGYALKNGLEQQKLAIDSGYWPLLRFDPRRETGSRLKLDSPEPKIDLEQFLAKEGRFKGLEKLDAEEAHRLHAEAQEYVRSRYKLYELFARGEAADIEFRLTTETLITKSKGLESGSRNPES